MREDAYDVLKHLNLTTDSSFELYSESGMYTLSLSGKSMCVGVSKGVCVKVMNALLAYIELKQQTGLLA